MGHLSSRILITSRVRPKLFDANLRVERAFVRVTESPLPDNVFVRKRKGPGHVVGGRKDSSSTTYLP